MIAIDYSTRRTIAKERGKCAICGRGFGPGARIIATVSRHSYGTIIHARAHLKCPHHLRLVSTNARAA